jgi:hypothetical protein
LLFWVISALFLAPFILVVGQNLQQYRPSLSSTLFFAIFEQNFSHGRLKVKQHYSYSLQSTPKSRPTGVTIIAILNIIGGIIMLIGAIALIAIGAILPTLPQLSLTKLSYKGT